MKENLLKLAKNHELNVEDIIEVAFSRKAEVANILQEIKSELGWQNESIEHENGSITPPMGMWVDVGCIYIEKGFEGLVNFSNTPQNAYFSISFLQEYKAKESVLSLLSIADKYTNDIEKNKETILKIAGALNLLLSFKGAPLIDENTTEKVRNFIHSCISVCVSNHEYGAAICALRGVGNKDSINLIKKIPKLKDEWEGTENEVCRKIRKRLKKV